MHYNSRIYVLSKILLFIAIFSVLLLCGCGCADRGNSTTAFTDPTIAYDDPATVQGVTQENYDNYSVFVFDGFTGDATLKMERKDMEKGKIYFYAELTDGAMHVMYRRSPWDSVEMMASLAGGVKMPDNNIGGLVSGDEIAIIFDAESAVSGRLVISFVPLGDTE